MIGTLILVRFFIWKCIIAQTNIKTLFQISNYKRSFLPYLLGDTIDQCPNERNQNFEKDAYKYMRGGFNYADFITTVSKIYAEEIKNSFYLGRI